MTYEPNIVGVIGSGSFGTTIAGLIAKNCDVLIYSRKEEVVSAINSGEKILGYLLPKNIRATTSVSHLCKSCLIIVPVLPSSAFRETMSVFSPYLHPYHVIIHATKGFDLFKVDLEGVYPRVRKNNIRTMSSLVSDETQVVRVGCISGPNLSTELRRGLPAATVIASEYDEVINVGQQILHGPGFRIYGSHDVVGTEIAGALKNMIAVGTGMISGLALGKNIEALFITRGLREMLILGKSLGADSHTFFGAAGIGDLIATATSADSRNFAFGVQIARGKTKEQIEKEFDQLTEGVRTIKLMHHFALQAQLEVPIVEMLYAVIFGGLALDKAIEYLLDYPYGMDSDYI